MKAFFRKTGIMMTFYTVAYLLMLIGLSMYKSFSAVPIEQVGENVIVENGNSFFYVILVIIALVLLDVWSTVEYWIESKRKELYIRKLCGAKNSYLCFELIRHFSCLMVIAFTVSSFVYFIFWRNSTFAFDDATITATEIITIFLSLLILGNLLNLLEIRKIWKKSVSDMKG